MSSSSKSSTSIGPAADDWQELSIDDAELQKLLDEPLPSQDPTKLRTSEQHAGFDNNMGDSWLYPNNYPQRAYQFSITQAALYRNTLVVLPTGLGKTFIAAVVMYNIYRWYPTGKIIFMAPTRPLVAQQIEACQHIMPFPSEDTVELTGKLQRARRTELWQSKRVFFATPQVVQSDIAGPEPAVEFPYNQVKLIVVDEAHRAKGRYAYAEVVQAIWQRNRYFRVLALSATPGRTMEDVAEVVRNLFISHLEVRWDNSLDVLPYVHKRVLRTVVVPLDEEIKRTHEELLQIIDPYLRELIEAQVLSGSLTNINRNFLLFEQKRFRDYSQRQKHPQQAAVSTNFAVCISLFHALELLERHGLRVFVNNFEEDEEGRAKFVLNMDRRLRALLDRLREQLGPNPFEVSAQVMTNGKLPEIPSVLDFGHPKFEEARKCVLQHFETHPDSRAIVFCEYRESVMLMYRLLLQHTPLLKPRCFVGHGGTTGPLRALTQKQQIQIMQDFRAGKSNILVATSIGEEGIDVGEVELIVCFDIQSSNPQRLIQRIGRTGRQKQGNVVMLVTEGREQQLLKDVLAQKDVANKRLLRSTVVQGALYTHAPRLVPTEYSPKCVHTYIKPPEQQKVTQKEGKQQKKKSARSKSKTEEIKNTQDLRTFFKKPAKLTETVSTPSTQTQKLIERSLNKINDYFKDIDSPLRTQTQSLTPKEADLKRLRRLSKIFKGSGSQLTPAERIESPMEQLKSAKLSKEGKLYLLKQQPDIVRQILENMKVVEALEIEAGIVSVEEEEIRATYALIERLLGGTRAAIEKFLDDIELAEMQRECENNPDDLFDVSDGEFDNCVAEIFDGLKSRDFYCDNFDFIETELKKTQSYQQFVAKEQQSPCNRNKEIPRKDVESMVYETMMVEEDDSDVSSCSLMASKYHSQCQWEDFAKSTPINKSTPLHGPLAKAFLRQQQKGSKAHGVNLLQRLVEGHEECEDMDMDDVIFVAQTESNGQEKTYSTMSSIEIKETENNESITANSNSPINRSLSHDKNGTGDLKNQQIINKNAAEPLHTNTMSSNLSQSHKDTSDSVEKLLSELDFDLDVFMEPFSEEETERTKARDSTKVINPVKSPVTIREKEQFISPEPTVFDKNPTTNALNSDSNANLNSGQKENENLCNLLRPVVDERTRQSPDLFELDTTKTPVKNVNTANAQNASVSPLYKMQIKTPTKQIIKVNTPSPKRTEKYTKSPSVFDLYLKNTRGRRKLLHLGSQYNASHAKITPQLRAITSLPTRLEVSTADKSVIMPQRNTTTKRKFRIDSDASDEEFSSSNAVKQLPQQRDVETECEEIAETQMPNRCTFRQQCKKRRRLHAFIEDEAEVSGTDSSEDEPEPYVKDSIVISSDEASQDGVNVTQMQAHYLQSLKSPRQPRRGAFKIPNFRVFNDQSHIYSQPLPIDIEPSQYISDSFVVDEENVKSYSEEVSMCPLERAERILKERRRARRNKRRIIQIADSSDDNES